MLKMSRLQLENRVTCIISRKKKSLVKVSSFENNSWFNFSLSLIVLVFFCFLFSYQFVTIGIINITIQSSWKHHHHYEDQFINLIIRNIKLICCSFCSSIIPKKKWDERWDEMRCILLMQLSKAPIIILITSITLLHYLERVLVASQPSKSQHFRSFNTFFPHDNKQNLTINNNTTPIFTFIYVPISLIIIIT